MFRPKRVIPMHYDTFDLIRQDPELMRKGLEGRDVMVEILKPGEETEI